MSEWRTRVPPTAVPHHPALILALARRERLDQDLDAEVRSHLALMTDEKIAEGMKPEEARGAAKIELGGVEQVKERVREARGAAWLDILLPA